MKTNLNIKTKSDSKIYKEARELILKENNYSISYVQRKLRIGYNKAAIIVEKLIKDGIRV